MRYLLVIALIWVAFVLALIVIHVIAPQRSGPLALTEIFEPYIALTGLLACVFAFMARRPGARPLVLVFLALFVARCVPGAVSNPGPGIGDSLSVMTWNIEYGADQGARALAGVFKSEAELVALQELQAAGAEALRTDATLARRLPNRVLVPDASIRGLGLMSAYPILEHSFQADPPVLRAVVKPLDEQNLVVFVVHPLPARFLAVGPLPIGLDATKRDADISLIRSMIDADLAAGRRVIVLGDINTTEREPAYAEFARDLRDAHGDAGIGPGFTWRPPQLASLPFGMLRIDYVLVSTPIAIESTFTDCSLPSDHCRLDATIKLGIQLW